MKTEPNRFSGIMSTEEFSIENLDISEIQKISNLLPRTKVIDSNIAEKYIICTIEAQDLCQEKMIQVERWIGMKRIALDKEEAESALIRAKDAGHKTAKEKDWFVQSDQAVMDLRDELDKAKVAKIWLDNKIKYFSMWHYSLRAFIKRDYNIEKSSTYSTFGETPEYNIENGEDDNHRSRSFVSKDKEFCDDIPWK